MYNVSSVHLSFEFPGVIEIMSADAGQAKVTNVASAPPEAWGLRDPSLMLLMSSFVSGEEQRREIDVSRSEANEAATWGSGGLTV